jgi:hypothetical protein
MQNKLKHSRGEFDSDNEITEKDLFVLGKSQQLLVIIGAWFGNIMRSGITLAMCSLITDWHDKGLVLEKDLPFSSFSNTKISLHTFLGAKCGIYMELHQLM